MGIDILVSYMGRAGFRSFFVFRIYVGELFFEGSIYYVFVIFSCLSLVVSGYIFYEGEWSYCSFYCVLG